MGDCCKACKSCASRKANPSRIVRVDPRSAAEMERIKHYAVTHWGLEGNKKMTEASAGDPRDPSTLLGYLESISYIAPKGTVDASIWDHIFSSRNPPALTYTRDGKLLIVGGGYSVGARGIKG